jgi:DNA-binding LacI/PurR family transcriptional regulator
MIELGNATFTGIKNDVCSLPFGLVQLKIKHVSFCFVPGLSRMQTLPKTNSSRPSIRQIAKIAGVAPCTVSRVLNAKNGEVPIREATREKVLEACARFNYHPNVHALRLFSRRCNVVAVLIPSAEHMPSGELSGEAVHHVLVGVARAADIHNYEVLMIPVTEKFLHRKRYLELYRGRSVDGMLIYGLQNDQDYVRELLAENCPMVLIHSHYSRSDISQVNTNSRESSRKIAQKIIEAGHRHIAYIGSLVTSNVANERREGFFEACREAGIAPLFEMGDFSAQSGYQAAKYLLTQDRPPTAIATANDMMALGVMKVAHELDIDVPSGLSVVGADGAFPHNQPELCTISVPYATLGETGFECLMDKLNRSESTNQLQQACELIVPSGLSEGQTLFRPSLCRTKQP